MWPSIVSISLTILQNEILNENTKKIIGQIDDLTELKTMDVQKPLFLIDENKVIENICLSSIFYGSIFSFIGSFPLIVVPTIGFYGIYEMYKQKKES